MKRMILTLTLLAGLSLPAAADPGGWQYEWPDTDFSQTTVANWTEIMSGGPPKDGIPAIDKPTFVAGAEEAGLEPRESVIPVKLPGQRARAYPLRYLMWHEIVNDTIGDVPVAVTYCPLCNSAIVFDRRTAQGTLSFGVSGKLRNSDMVMYDRQTQSWWQQALGIGIVGELTGMKLTQLPVWMESWAAYRSANPDGLVMAEPQFRRAYGRNPYRRYDSSARPFLYSGENPPHGVPPLMRVVRVGDAAWTMERLRAEGEIRENGVVLTWVDEQSSALDSGHVGDGKAVGAVRVRNGSGADLAHDVMFAFAFHAFWPEGNWMLK